MSFPSTQYGFVARPVSYLCPTKNYSNLHRQIRPQHDTFLYGNAQNCTVDCRSALRENQDRRHLLLKSQSDSISEKQKPEEDNLSGLLRFAGGRSY
jgi:hypothetical protein